MGTVTLTAAQVRDAVSMSEAIAAVRQGFLDLAAGRFEMPTRTALRDGQFLDMAVHHRPTGSAMFKTLSLNFGGRDPAICGSVVWSDLDRTTQLVADATTVTTLRTGAATGVATDLLASPEAHRCVVIGAGGQAPDQIRAVCAVRALDELVLVSRTRSRTEALAATMANEFPDLAIRVGDDLAAEVGDTDIVCCVTTSHEPLFALDDLPERVHVNAVGAFRPTMRELPDALMSAGTFVIDEREAILEESGEVLHALGAGELDKADMVELGDALAEGVDRTSRTTFKSVGVAMQDWAIARLLADRFLG